MEQSFLNFYTLLFPRASYRESPIGDTLTFLYTGVLAADRSYTILRRAEPNARYSGY